VCLVAPRYAYLKTAHLETACFETVTSHLLSKRSAPILTSLVRKLYVIPGGGCPCAGADVNSELEDDVDEDEGDWRAELRAITGYNPAKCAVSEAMFDAPIRSPSQTSSQTTCQTPSQTTSQSTSQTTSQSAFQTHFPRLVFPDSFSA
jgi:hypothetical protein